ncbi:hypothetical protein ABKN59_002399 [Abortiporus biennis]
MLIMVQETTSKLDSLTNIPIEIVVLIISFLHKDTTSLSSLRLVSRSFLSLCQVPFFRGIQILEPTYPLSSSNKLPPPRHLEILAALRRNPPWRSYVRELTIFGTGCMPFVHYHRMLTTHSLSQICSFLPQLESLTLNNVALRAESHGSLGRLSSIRRSLVGNVLSAILPSKDISVKDAILRNNPEATTIRSLSLYSVKFESSPCQTGDFLSLISILPDIKTLLISDAGQFTFDSSYSKAPLEMSLQGIDPPPVITNIDAQRLQHLDELKCIRKPYLVLRHYLHTSLFSHLRRLYFECQTSNDIAFLKHILSDAPTRSTIKDLSLCLFKGGLFNGVDTPFSQLSIDLSQCVCLESLEITTWLFYWSDGTRPRNDILIRHSLDITRTISPSHRLLRCLSLVYQSSGWQPIFQKQDFDWKLLDTVVSDFQSLSTFHFDYWVNEANLVDEDKEWVKQNLPMIDTAVGCYIGMSQDRPKM